MSATLTFAAPPLGLDPHNTFVMTDIDGAEGLYSLHSADNPQVRLFVLDAAVFLPDYTPVITDEDCVRLNVHTPDDALVLVVTNPADDGTTVNLLAPIVVNAVTGASAQIILDGQDWPLRATLPALVA